MSTPSFQLQLPLALQVINTPRFSSVLRKELLVLDPELHKLQPLTHQGGVIAPSSLAFTTLGVKEEKSRWEIKLGVMFEEIVGGCNCHDDPLQTAGYGECLLHITKSDASALMAFT
ncbi:MAG: glucosamine--fructose-6-phosphate aminotransferase [bacterium]